MLDADMVVTPISRPALATFFVGVDTLWLNAFNEVARSRCSAA